MCGTPAGLLGVMAGLAGKALCLRSCNLFARSSADIVDAKAAAWATPLSIALANCARDHVCYQFTES